LFTIIHCFFVIIFLLHWFPVSLNQQKEKTINNGFIGSEHDDAIDNNIRDKKEQEEQRKKELITALCSFLNSSSFVEEQNWFDEGKKG